MYHTSKSLLDVETEYQRMKKMAPTLFIVSRMLKYYFQSFYIVVLTEHPLKSIMENSQATKRISMWAMELKPNDIKYEPRTIMEEQVLVSFIVEFTSGTPAQSDLLKGWTLNVDEASNNKSLGIRIVLTTMEGDHH